MRSNLRWFVLAALLGVSSCQHVSAAGHRIVEPQAATISR